MKVKLYNTTTPANVTGSFAGVVVNLGYTMAVTNNICIITSYSGVGIAKDKRCFKELSNNLCRF